MGMTLREALLVTAARLREGAAYQWGHFGSCNCGHLAQTLTRRDKADLHRLAVERAADWGDAAVAYCPGSGLPMDHVIDEMLAVGVSLSEIRHLETLSDRRVLRALPLERRHLQRNQRDDVVLYLETWASLLPDELPLAAE